MSLPTWVASAIPALTAAEGFTLHPDTGMYNGNGYSVGVYPERERRIPRHNVPLLDIIRELYLFAQMNHDLLTKPQHYIGGWEEAGQLVLDIAVVTQSRPEAELLGATHHQVAYYAFDTADSHPLVNNLIGA